MASWARYAEGVDEQGEPIEVVDRLADRLTRRRRRQGDDPLAFVANRDLSATWSTSQAFTEPYLSTLESLHSDGAAATVATLHRIARIRSATHAAHHRGR